MVNSNIKNTFEHDLLNTNKNLKDIQTRFVVNFKDFWMAKSKVSLVNSCA